jgi:hypothetical protein
VGDAAVFVKPQWHAVAILIKLSALSVQSQWLLSATLICNSDTCQNFRHTSTGENIHVIGSDLRRKEVRQMKWAIAETFHILG